MCYLLRNDPWENTPGGKSRCYLLREDASISIRLPAFGNEPGEHVYAYRPPAKAKAGMTVTLSRDFSTTYRAVLHFSSFNSSFK
jgi:hypothetical protein